MVKSERRGEGTAQGECHDSTGCQLSESARGGKY